MKADALSVSLPSHSARIMGDVLYRRAGVHWQDFCDRSGVEVRLLQSQNSIAAEAELRMQQAFSASTANATDLWVQLGLQYRAASYGTFGIAMMTAGNLGEIFANCAKFQPLTFSMIRYNFMAENDGSGVLIADDQGIPGPFREFTQYRDLGLLRTLIQDLVGNTNVLERIALAAPPPGNWDQLKKCFPCDVDFNADVTRWIFRPGTMDVPAIMSDHNLFAAYSEECIRILENEYASTTMLEQLEEFLNDHENGFPSLGEVARRFAMSERTLHRRLKEEGRTLSKIIGEIKIRKAKSLLANKNAAVPDVAMKLCFSDTSSFCRAFKRSTGMSIREFRQDMQKQRAYLLTSEYH